MEALVITAIWFMVGTTALGWILIGITPFVMAFVSLITIQQCLVSLMGRPEENSDLDCVLVVDDDYETVIPLLKLLESAKVPFKYVANGVEAIRELSCYRFRLVFMDKNMPSLDGIETLKRADLMMENNEQAVPVVFFTGTQLIEYPLKLAHLSIIQTWNKSMGILNLKSQLNQVLANY